MQTQLSEMFDIEFPIFAFTHCRDVVAAVSNAGGFGVLGAVGFTPEQLEIELDWIDAHVDGKPYGVDTVMPQKSVSVEGGSADAMLETIRQMIDANHWRYVDELMERFELPPLPDRFVAVKFYTGRALVDSPRHREMLRGLVERISRTSPIVTLNTHLALDEHDDYVFQDVPGVMTLDRWMTPQNNLGVQTEVIRRASRFVGTCGSLAWLAPMLGTDTLAVYADDHFLTPHLYAARHAYASMDAARFTAMDLALLDQIDVLDSAERSASRVTG